MADTEIGVDLGVTKYEFQRIRILPVKPPRTDIITLFCRRHDIPIDDLWALIKEPYDVFDIAPTNKGAKQGYDTNAVIQIDGRSTIVSVDTKDVELISEFKVRADVNFYTICLGDA